MENSKRPYENISVSQDYIVRKFSANTDEEEFVWHRDAEDRIVKVLECGKGWAFQFDEELPYNIEVGTEIFIHAEEYHRVHKGEGDLLVQITLGFDKYEKEEA